MTNEVFADELDETLVRLSVSGNSQALETLIRRHKDWIFNIAIRMTGNSRDADDVTQEVIIKLITKLSGFQFKSGFRTWLYRMTVNHFLTMRRRGKEGIFTSFDKHRAFLKNLGNSELQAESCLGREMVIEETKNECLLAMLLCLNREQRMVFILGGIFALSGKAAAETLGISEVSFRKKLSRARQDLKNYMEHNCGLVSPDNSCRCSKKARAAIDAGYVSPHSFNFTDRHLMRVHEFIRRQGIMVEDVLEWRQAELFREQPYKVFEESKIVALIQGVEG